MKECKDCEYRGYSPEFCVVHVKSCRHSNGNASRFLPRPVKIGVSALAWASVGVAVVCVGFTAVSLVGSAALLHTELLKLGAGAGLAGGGVGLYKGLLKNRGEPEIGDLSPDDEGMD